MKRITKSFVLTTAVIVVAIGFYFFDVHPQLHRAEGSVPVVNGLLSAIDAFERTTGRSLSIHQELPQITGFPAVGTIKWKEFHSARGGVVLTGQVSGTGVSIREYYIEFSESSTFQSEGAAGDWSTEQDAQDWLTEYPDLKEAKLWGIFRLPGPKGTVRAFITIHLSNKTFELIIHPSAITP